MNDVGAQIARKSQAMARNLAGSRRLAVSAASLVVKNEVLASAQQRFGGRLRNMGRSGVKLNARFDVKGFVNLVSIIRAVPPGAWAIAEKGAKAHGIRPRRRGGKRALSTPYGPKARVSHPGMTGRRPFALGVRRAEPKVKVVLRKHATDALVKGFRS